MLELLEKLGAAGRAGSDPERAQFAQRLQSVLARRNGQTDKIAYHVGIETHHLKAAEIIEHNLSANDFYVRAGDNAFIIVYPMLRRRDSRLKAAMLRRTLESELSDATVDLQEATLDSSGVLAFAPCPDLDSLISELIRESEAAAEQDIDGPSTASPDKPAPRLQLEGIGFVYRPMLTLQTKMVSTFIVVPTREIGRNRFESGYQVLNNPGDASEILELDQMTLVSTVAELKQLMGSGGRSLFAVPVHFETLASSHRGREYAQLCGSKLAGLEKRIVFEIEGLPDRAPQSRLAEIVAKLAPTSRAVIARFPSDSCDFFDYRTSGLHAVGIDVYSSSKGERELMGEIDRFVETARKSRLKSYIQGIRSLSLLTAAISTGFDYIAGHALGAACPHAQDIKAFEMGESYRGFVDIVASGSKTPESSKPDFAM